MIVAKLLSSKLRFTACSCCLFTLFGKEDFLFSFPFLYYIFQLIVSATVVPGAKKVESQSTNVWNRRIFSDLASFAENVSDQSRHKNWGNDVLCRWSLKF